MTLEIKQYDSVMQSPAWGMIPFAISELHLEGLLQFQPELPAADDACLVAFIDEIPVGFVCYRPDNRRGTWWIMLSWVIESKRKEGIHTQLFKALVERGEKRGDILSIECGTHVGNLPAQAAFEKQGRKLCGYIYEYHLKEPVGRSHLDIT